MKSTGVVRRVDDLGRIVIPKEIRRNLRIRDGEELEIFVDGENILLRKFSKIADLSGVSKKIIDVVSSLLGKTLLVTDRDMFITGSGDLKKNYINKEISRKIIDIMERREIVVEKNVSAVELVQGIIDKYSYVICPIVSYGDVIGNVILLSISSNISEFDITICQIVTQFLGKYVED